jgi:mono/diheme cytochrome c family protein
VLAMSLTGYLLPWDQKGFWATQVATNIAGNLPVAGSFVQKVVVGGPEYGNHTLTRFYALHVALIPPLIVVLIIAHLVVFRRHGLTVPLVTIPRDEEGEPLPAKGDAWFWPDQAFRDMVVSMVLFGVLLGLVIWGHGHKVEAAQTPDRTVYDRIAHAGRDGRGANLDAPADPARPYPARPEWYFLFLFQLLKYFEGEQELIGTVVIPAGVGALLFVLPLLGYGRMRRFGHVVGVIAVAGLLLGAGTLTALALYDDRATGMTDEQIAELAPGAPKQDLERRQLFRHELAAADEYARRAIQIAHDGIPVEGAIYLLRRDPLTQGRKLFEQTCATCHAYGDEFKDKQPTASDLAEFGTREWIRGLLQGPESPQYFGHTKLRTMSKWVKSARKKEDGMELDIAFDQIAGWLAGHPRAPVPNEKDRGPFAQGFRAFQERCMECHTYQGQGGGSTPAPDFTGYGDAAWVRLMVMAPNHPLRYGKRNAMPAFRDLEGPAAGVTLAEWKLLNEAGGDVNSEKKDAATKLVHLSDVDRELIIRWLLKDYRVVFGGEPISGPSKR